MKPGESNPILFDLYDTGPTIENISTLARLRHLTDDVRKRIAEDYDELVSSNTLSGCISAIENGLQTGLVRGMDARVENFLSKPYDHFDNQGVQLATRIVMTQFTPGSGFDHSVEWQRGGDIFLLALAAAEDRYILPHHVKVGWGIDEEDRFGAFKITESLPQNTLRADIRNRYTAEPLNETELQSLVSELHKFMNQP